MDPGDHGGPVTQALAKGQAAGRTPFREAPAGPVPHLRVNLTVDRGYDYRFLFGLVSLAMRHGGRLERCNASGAEFAFPHGKVAGFMGEVGTRVAIRRTWVSPRDQGGSHVNVRFGD